MWKAIPGQPVQRGFIQADGIWNGYLPTLWINNLGREQLDLSDARLIGRGGIRFQCKKSPTNVRAMNRLDSFLVSGWLLALDNINPDETASLNLKCKN
jgi:hypothetical protein